MNNRNDDDWMLQALALAERGRGAVEPNPMVGAVVLDSKGIVVGEGWHERFGGPHAEVNALEKAKARANGGSLIVTLEPCCHTGKTPPCTDAVIRSRISRVVIAMSDPFPQVSGGGIEQLKAAGLEVVVGVREAEARKLNAPYLKLVQTGQPWVHLKWAMTLDGKIATRGGDSKWISGERSREQVHQLRGRVDAIVVGGGTVRADDPKLTARPAGPRTAARVVLTRYGRLPEQCKLRDTAGKIPVIVFVAGGNESRLAGWRQDGVELVTYTSQSDAIKTLLTELGKRRMTNILVEGGAGVTASFLEARAVDELHIFVAPKIVGGTAAISPVGGNGMARIADAIAISDLETQASGEDIYLHGFMAKPAPTS